MKNIILTTILFMTFFPSLGQIKCEEVKDVIEGEGEDIGSLSSFQLIESSWLKSIQAYEFDSKIFVIAEIKTNEYSFQSKKYIFCGIPYSNWKIFYSRYTDSSLSIGEKFHKYIIDYKCNCD